MEAWIKRLLISFLLLVIILFFLKFSFVYLTPFIIGVLLASLINPLVNKLEELYNLERSFLVFIVLAFFISILLIFLFIGIFQIYLELNSLLNCLPDYDNLKENITWIIESNNNIISSWNLPSPIEEMLKDNFQLSYNALKDGIIYIINNLLNILGKLPIILSVLIISFIASYFISRDVNKINRFIMGLFPLELRPNIHRLEKELISSAMGFLRAEIVLVFITGIISFLGLRFIGSDYRLTLAFFAGFLDLIPFIGPGILFIPWILFSMVSGNLLFAFKLLVLYTIITGVRQGIEGKIFAYHLGLHPLLIMIGFYLGYKLLGPIGFIIGPGTIILGKGIFNSGIFSNTFSFKE